jgi:TPR repeat protein
MLLMMEKSWFSKIFSRSEEVQPRAPQLEADCTEADAQFRRGLNFASGAGVPRDYGQAAQWYRKAAEQNHALAQFNLGVMYSKGQGVVRDDAQAAAWFGLAANLGDAGAQYNLGRICQRASMDGPAAGAVEARIEAYKWYQLAAAQGYQHADGAYASLTPKMTRADVAEANQRVARFAPVAAPKPLLAAG